MATGTGSTGAPLTQPADIGLRREMGLIGATWASETSIIGSGWLFAGMNAAVLAGPAAIYGWLIGGACAIVLALLHAELGGMYPVAGGTARFPHLAFGSVAGVSFGFFSWLQAVTVAPVECYAVMTYGQYYWHSIYNPATGRITGLGFGMTIVLMAIFTAINFLGVRLFSRINSGITWWKVAIPVITIVIFLFKFHGGNFSPGGGGFMPFGIKAVFSAIPSAGIVFSYLGFEQADQLAGEIKNPQKNLPRAIIIAILLGTFIYCMAQIVLVGATPPSLLTHGFQGIATGNPVLVYPFAAVAGLAGLGVWATILHIDAFVSPFGTGMIYQTSTSRIGYGLARNRYYPQVFQWVDKNGVPWFSLIMAFVFGIFFLLPFPSWQALVGLVTGASVLMYAGAPLSLGAFRRQVPDHPRPYRVPVAAVISPLGFIVANMIIYWSGFNVIWKLGACIVIGYVIIGICMIFDKQRPPLDWKSAQWLPVYLIGMGLISWFGQFGSGAPPINNGRLPFWWDMLVVAAFSLAIYFWAMWARLPRREVDRLVELQSARMGDAPATPRH
ncbi:MAG: family permease [Actinomycetia bacterium]|jgi:amino acid transporter|nr:family permease [Actinomycetes bacterium]